MQTTPVIIQPSENRPEICFNDCFNTLLFAQCSSGPNVVACMTLHQDYFINQDCKDNKGGSWKAIPKIDSIFGEMQLPSIMLHALIRFEEAQTQYLFPFLSPFF